MGAPGLDSRYGCRCDALGVRVSTLAFGVECTALNLRVASTFRIEDSPVLDLSEPTTLDLRGALTFGFGRAVLGFGRAPSFYPNCALSLELCHAPTLSVDRLGVLCRVGAALGVGGLLARELDGASALGLGGPLAFALEGTLPFRLGRVLELCCRDAPSFGVCRLATFDLRCSLPVHDGLEIVRNKVPHGLCLRPAGEAPLPDRSARNRGGNVIPTDEQRLGAIFVAPPGDIVALVLDAIEQ